MVAEQPPRVCNIGFSCSSWKGVSDCNTQILKMGIMTM